MKKHISHSFLLRCSFGALLLAASTLHGQVNNYYPGNFALEISFGCNCCCDTNSATNNPVGGFLATNGVINITGRADLAAGPTVVQYVPKHWALLDSGNLDFEGWTKTEPAPAAYGTLSQPLSPAANFSNPIYPYPLIPFNYYEGPLDPLTTANAGVGAYVDQPELLPLGTSQPYPWDVNATMTLQNGQLYVMEQQLVVGPYPPYWGVTAGTTDLETPVTYLETNSLLTISLYCVGNGTTNLLAVSYPTITAELLPNPVGNIPLPLNDVTPDIPNVGELFTDDIFTNWTWPLTPTDSPDLSGTSPGAGYTVQASLPSYSPAYLGGHGWAGYVAGPANIDHTALLVRAKRAYRLTLQYALTNDCTGNPYVFMNPLVITNTGLVPPCTNMQIVFYTTNCSACTTNPTFCPSTNTGLVDMLGTPNVWPTPPDSITSGITLWAIGDNNIFSENLPGSVLPETFQLGVVTSTSLNNIYRKWATENLGLNTSYEYFSSPELYPVQEPPCGMNDLTNIFVMCPTNPGIVQGNITLNGPVSPCYYNGQGALSFLQFAVYNNSANPDLPYDPIVPPSTPWNSGDPAGAADPTLQHVSSIQATGGKSASSPFNYGGGDAITEFDNPGVFHTLNSYSGHYSLKLAGLQSQPSVWSAGDVHLVFGDPVNLDYHIIETTNVNISCGTNVINNITNCFGLLTIQVHNFYWPTVNYSSVSIQVSGSGPGYTIPPFTVTSYQGNANNASFPLFLPQGTYTVQEVPQVINSQGGTETLHPPATNYVVGCDSVTNCPCTNPPVILMNALYSPPCTNSAGAVVVSGSVISGSAVTLTYSLNNQAAQPVPVIGNQYSFLLTLLPGPNIITLTATDAYGCIGTLTESLNNGNVTPCPTTLPCTTNKTVAWGSVWGFDPPPAFTPCCGSNVTVVILNTVTNVSFNPCEINYTRTWQVTDCCTNTATCSQTVTVIPTGPCQVFNTGMNGAGALLGGALDPNFVLVSVPTTPAGAGTSALVMDPSDIPGSYLAEGPNSQWIGPNEFGQDQPEGVYHYQVTFLLCCTNGAELSGQVAMDNTGGVYLNNNTQVASISGSSAWSYWTQFTANSGFVPGLNTLDIYVTNNGSTGDPGKSQTGMRAEVTNCISPLLVHCPGDKGVPCGSIWTFDQPTASSCCGSNVVTAVLSTVTNGVAHITFTGGGSAANGVVDFVGNTATSGFLDITAGTNMGTYTLSPGSGSNTLFLWDGLIFPTSNPFLDLGGLLFTNGGVEINLYGNGPGSYTLAGAPPAYAPQVTNGVATLAVCPQMITRTWLFTDACGNTNTCSQTVTVVDTTPPVLTCASNKTVTCGTAWSFDAPTAFDACSGTNVNLIILSTATNGVCPQVITQTWLATDACGNTNTCSQTVTVTSAPPVIVCSTNKTIPCTSNVVFDLPTVVSACCGTNYSITVFGSDVTTNAGPDAYAITRTWLITDCCGSSNLCSQTVTVQDTTLYTWTTLAGLAGSSGSADGTGSAARFYIPTKVAVGTNGNVYVADTVNYTIRKVSPTGVVTTLAGLAGSSGSADGTGSAARFNSPSGVAVDSAGNVYVADHGNYTIRKVTPVGTNWVVTTLAGQVGQYLPLGQDGTGSAARFFYPNGIAVDSAGNLYVADTLNFTIRKVTSVGTNWVVTTLAGLAGTSGTNDGTGSAARFDDPLGVAVDSAGNLYVADETAHTIRKVTPAGTNWLVTTLAQLDSPADVAVDGAGNVFVGDANNTISKVTPAGVVTTLGGLAGSAGSADGTDSAARFNNPKGVAVDSAGNVYVADQSNDTIRKGAPAPCLTNPCPLVNTIGLNTGFDQTAGTVYSIGAADAFWWVTKDPTVPATTLPRPATVILRNPAWKLPQPNSQWISSYPTEEDNLNGEYDFATYFCLTTNASNVVVSVCLRADDAAGAYLNGHQITLSPADTTFKAASPACGTASMGLNPAWFLLGGQNVLQVRVTNIYAVAMGLNLAGSVTGTGLSVETASCCRPASGISGQKFHDLNGNGVRDPGEPARVGWTINLSGGATAVTDVNGYYYFQNLAAGTYTVTEVPQSGWTQTAPAGGSYTVTLGVSQQVNGRDFGNYRTNDTNCVHIFCPSNIVTECTGSGAVVPFTVTATSLCTTNPPVVTCTPPSTTLFPVGSTLVHCTAEDSLGDWATCSFTVTVQDTTPPVITCPSNIVIVSCSTNVPVGWSVTATDMCSSVTVTSSPPSGTIFHRDTTNTVTVVATDGSGNTNTCSFLVIVRKPTLNIAIGSGGFPVTVSITWLDGGILQQADTVFGPWTDIPLATSPYTVVASGSQKFYRLRCP